MREEHVDLPSPDELRGAKISEAGNYPNQHFENPGFFSEYSGQDYRREVNKKNVIIVFGDIRKYSSIAGEQYLSRTTAYLNVFFGYVSALFAPSEKGEGIMKFMGDGFFVSFNNTHKSAIRVAERAIRLRKAFNGICGRADSTNFGDNSKKLELSLAILEGEVACCVLGGKDYKDRTIIGSRVNSASRFCSVAIGNQILLDNNVHGHYCDKFVYVYTGKLDLRHVLHEESYSLIRAKKSSEIKGKFIRECCSMCEKYSIICEKRFSSARGKLKLNEDREPKLKRIYETECDEELRAEVEASQGSIKRFCYDACQQHRYLCLINTTLGQSEPNVGATELKIKLESGARIASQMVCCDRCRYFAEECPKYGAS